MVTKKVILVGGGGIGGHTALLLAQMLPQIGYKKLVIYDFDTIEAHNLDNQPYFSWDIGRLKTEVLQWYIRGLAHPEIVEFKNKRVTEKTQLKGIVVVTVDNLETRQVICEMVAAGNPHGNYAPLLIEAGAAENFGIIYVLDPNDPDQMAQYRETLFGKNIVSEIPDPCVDPELGRLMAGVIGRIIRKFRRWRPLKLHRIEIDLGELTEIRTRIE